MYESPIKLIEQQMQAQLESTILRAVQNVGVDVDKEELLRALQYDREQYEKGYQDAMDSIVRCKDCKHRHNGKDCTHPLLLSWSWGAIRNVKDNDFCSYGERRNDG